MSQDTALVVPAEGTGIEEWGHVEEERVRIVSNMGRVETVQAINEDAERLAELAPGAVLLVKHVVQHTVTMTDPTTGEIRPGWRTVIIDEETGKLYQTTSDAVRKSIMLLVAAHGAPPWEPQLRLAVKHFRTRQGFNTGLKLTEAKPA